MKQFRVIVTELHSAEYHVDAGNADEAFEKVMLGEEDCVESFYNETMKDRDDAYIVEITDDEDEKDKIQATSNGVKEYKERQEFFNDTENL